MKRILFATLILFVTATSSFAGEPTKFVESLLAEVAEINSTVEDDGEKTKAFKMLLSQKFDISKIGKFLVGRTWRHTRDDTRDMYMMTFKDYILDIWANRLGYFTGESKVISENVHTDGTIFVNTNVELFGTKSITVNFRLIEKDGSYKIIDVMTENVSLLIVMRSEFRTVVISRGIEGLIVMMREKMDG